MLSGDVSRGEVLVTAPREVDIATAHQLADNIVRACGLHPDRVVVDFSASTFCDTTAVDVLLDAAQALQSQGCVLQIRPNAMLTRIGRVLGVAEALGLPPD